MNAVSAPSETLTAASRTVAADSVTVTRLVRLDVEHADLETGVELRAVFDDGSTRPVLVRVGSGRTWYAATRFPMIGSDATESLGSDELDEAARRRAAELLVVVDAACRAMEARCAA